MSLDATRWAWMRKGLRPSAKLVLLALADRAGADDCAFPSCETIAEDTGLDRKAILRALASLRDNEIISDTGDRRGVTGKVLVYQLHGVEHRTAEDGNRPQSGTVPKEEQFPKGTRNRPQKGTVNRPQKGTQNLPVEPTKEPTKIKGAPWVLSTTIDPQTWADFETHRKDIRKPLTDLARTANAKILANLTPAQQREAVDTTIANRWTGIFPPKTNGAAHAEKSLSAAEQRRADFQELARMSGYKPR